jgi:hypothetical protein
MWAICVAPMVNMSFYEVNDAGKVVGWVTGVPYSWHIVVYL